MFTSTLRMPAHIVPGGGGQHLPAVRRVMPTMPGVFLWLACASSPPPEATLPEVPWDGGPLQAVGEPVSLDVDEAVALATEASGPPAPDGPDLGGPWRRVEPLPDGMRSVVHLQRTRLAPGVYDTRSVAVLEVDGIPALRVELEAWETFGVSHQCVFARRARAAYAVEGIDELLAPLVRRFEPTVLNATPCGQLVSVEADQVVGLHADGSTYHEKRL